MTNDAPQLLIVEDEDAMREVLAIRLGALGYEVLTAANGQEARAAVERHDPDAVISDVVLPDASGVELLRDLRGDHNSDPSDGGAGGPAGTRPVVLITAYGTIDTAVSAMKDGAVDFFTKPIDYERLAEVLSMAVAERRSARVSRQLTERLDGRPGLGPLVGESKAMRRLFKLIQILGESEASAIITGESGTGKELVAGTIHRLSQRREGPFIAVNSAAIPEGISESELFGHERGAFTGAVATRAGWFEQADGGTLFLDELAEMPIQLQPKLLRVLEEGTVRRLGGRGTVPFDVRLVAATNRDPAKAMERDQLRSDLYYRLSVFTIEMPPLRERGDDVLLLAQHFVDTFNQRHQLTVEGLSENALGSLAEYPWPGNVRELRNTVERAVILARGGLVRRSHLPDTVRRPSGALHPDEFRLPANVNHADAERLLILETLRRANNNKAEAARRLGLDVKTIRNKMKSWPRQPEAL